jgi:hypothetical protein
MDLTIKVIMVEMLEQNGFDGFDGLVNVGECGYEISDIMPCGNPLPTCCATHKRYINGDNSWVMQTTPGHKEKSFWEAIKFVFR